MSRKATVIIEGNARQQERVIHELNKLVSEANREPELNVSLQSQQIDTMDSDVDVSDAFTDGGQK